MTTRTSLVTGLCLLVSLVATGCDYENRVRTGLNKNGVDGKIGYMVANAFSTNDEKGRIGYVYIYRQGYRDMERPPVLFLAGGPGVAGTGLITKGRPLSETVREILGSTDFIIMDQPGVGLSTPHFDCKNKIAEVEGLAITRIVYGKAYAKAAMECRGSLIDQGFDMENFSSEMFAEGIEKLRKEVGAETLTILGTSYGTHLALHYARRYPDGVSALVLSGVEGFDDTLKLPVQLSDLFSAIDQSGKLEEKVKLAYDKIALGEESTIARERFATPYVFSRYLSGISGNRIQLDGIELILDRVLAGDLSEIENSGKRLVAQQIRPLRDVVDCASGVSKDRYDMIVAQMQGYPFGQAVAEPLLEGCESWGTAVVKDEVPEWRGVGIPVLMFAGTWDGRTPPRNALSLASNFESSTVLVIEGLAHEFCRIRACHQFLLDYIEGRHPSTSSVIYMDIQDEERRSAKE